MPNPADRRFGDLVPGSKVRSLCILDRVPSSTGEVRTSYRKGSTAIVLRHRIKDDDDDTVELLFEKVYAATSGLLLPANFQYRHAFVEASKLEAFQPFAPKPTADSELLYAIADLRDREPHLYAKQVHARLTEGGFLHLQDGTLNAPTLAAVKKCLSQWNSLRSCLLVNMRGAHELLNEIAGFVDNATLIALCSTNKSVYASLEEVRLQRVPLSVRLVKASFGLKHFGYVSDFSSDSDSDEETVVGDDDGRDEDSSPTLT